MLGTLPQPPAPIKELTLVQRREYIKQLRSEGLSAKEISQETGIKYGTVYNDLYQDKIKKSDPKQGASPEPGHNADRHLCKSCRYRSKSKGNACDYAVKNNHSRGCSVDGCTVYAKEG